MLEEKATLEAKGGDDWKEKYADGKRAAERYLLEHHGKINIIMRSTVIEGVGDPHSRTWFWIQRILDGSPIILSEEDNLYTKYKHVSSEDVAQAFF